LPVLIFPNCLENKLSHGQTQTNTDNFIFSGSKRSPHEEREEKNFFLVFLGALVPWWLFSFLHKPSEYTERHGKLFLMQNKGKKMPGEKKLRLRFDFSRLLLLKYRAIYNKIKLPVACL
jgi:hypothetical protein